MEESPQDQFFDPSVQQRGIDSLKLTNLTVNIQTELDLDHPDPIEPAPPHTSPALHTMSLRGAANSLAHISNALEDATMASPPPVYTLAHPLGLAHHAVPFATPTAPPNPIQITATTVATTLTHAPSQIGGGGSGGSGGGGGGGGSGGGGGGGGSDGGGGGGGGGPPGGQPPAQAAAPAAPANNGQGLIGKELVVFDGSRNKSETFIQEFELYAHVNEDNHVFVQLFKRIFLALSYMKGPKVNDWVRLMREQTILRVNGTPNNNPPILPINH